MYKKCRIKAPAKINLSLDITGKRDDGYHLMKTVMQSVSLFDEIEAVATDSEDIELSTNLGFLPRRDKNIVYKAARLFYEKTGIKTPGLKISLKKNIPVCAGLGGGSSDAAGILEGLSLMHRADISRDTLTEWGRTLGADVPFCLQKGTAFADGIGDNLKRCAGLPDCDILIVRPPIPVSTSWVFSNLDIRKIKIHPGTDGLVRAIESGDIDAMARRMYNVLENVTARRYQVICSIKDQMITQGAIGAVMSGSGPSVVGIFEKGRAEAACGEFSGDFEDVFLCSPIDQTEKLIELFE